MKLVIHPSVEQPRLDKIREAAGSMLVVNARDSKLTRPHARSSMPMQFSSAS